MQICKLTIRYDRGIERNRGRDLGLDKDDIPKETADGKPVRGGGTHYKSKEAKELAMERDREASRIQRAFRSRFLSMPLDGVYILDHPGQGKEFLAGLGVREDVQATCSEFSIEATGTGLEESDLLDWGRKVSNQLKGVPLGRGKKASEEGLEALATLANCPALQGETAERLRSLIEDAQYDRLNRVALKRAIGKLHVEVSQEGLVARPRRSSALAS